MTTEKPLSKKKYVIGLIPKSQKPVEGVTWSDVELAVSRLKERLWEDIVSPVYKEKAIKAIDEIFGEVKL